MNPAQEDCWGEKAGEEALAARIGSVEREIARLTHLKSTLSADSADFPLGSSPSPLYDSPGREWDRASPEVIEIAMPGSYPMPGAKLRRVPSGLRRPGANPEAVEEEEEEEAGWIQFGE